MKKFWKTLMFALVGAFALSSCEDVPAPYPIPNAEGGETPSTEGTLPYNSTNLNANWVKHSITEFDPWSQGSNYTQATGYQAWDGGSKTNKEVEGYLISPAINTTAESGKVKFSFDQTLRYENNDRDYAKHCLIYISKDYDGENFDAATWAQITDFVVTPSTTNDWTLYSSGDIQMPDEFVNQENVYVAFYFYAPASGSTTWELQNFKVEEGVAGEKPDTPGTDTTGEGTAQNPYTVADALKLIEAKANTSEKVYIKGKIVSVGLEKDGSLTDLPGSSYGNATYFISDDGQPANQLEVYRGYGLGGEKMTTSDYIKAGDEVIVYGTLTLFYETPEVATGSQLYELNGKKADDTPDPTPSGTPEGEGTEASPWNVAAVTQAFAANNSFYEANKEYYVKGIVTNVATYSSQYGSLSYYIADEANGTNTFYVYSGLGLEKSKFSGKSDLKAGDEVVVCGKFTVYNGTFEFQYNNYLVSLNGVTDPGDLPDNPDTPDNPDVSGNSITFSDQGYANAQDFNEQTITVGDAKLTFSKGSGSTTPKYYNTGNAMRLYGGNTLTISSSKTISKVVFSYGEDYNGTSYTPTSGDSSFTPGNYDYSTHTWTGSSNSIVLTRTATTGHFRIISIAISYAE